MCVSVAPARFSGTTVYAGEVARDGDVVHVAGYENTVANHADGEHPPGFLRRLVGVSAHPVGNAMLLHFPAVPGTMTRRNGLDTDGCPRLLRDMRTAVEGIPDAAPLLGAQAAARVEVFDTGIYTVVLAGDPRDIPAALDEVPERKRPPLNTALFDWYDRTFPGWPVALCCFDNHDAMRATPMMWWYEPAHPDWLFAPSVDCHTGAIPDLSADVRADHWVILGSSRLHEGYAVRYSDPIAPALAPYLPARVIGESFVRYLPNGDFLAPVDEVRAGRLDVRRGLLTAA